MEKLKKIDYKKLFLYVGVTLLGGLISTLLGGSTAAFDNLNKPPLAPPKILFPIVWTILYTLMGISYYLIRNTKDESVKLSYFIQLAINMVWPLIFFRFKAYLVALLWLALLIGSVVYMIIKFYNENKLSGLLQMPYIIWLGVAFYLNLFIYILN